MTANEIGHLLAAILIAICLWMLWLDATDDSPDEGWYSGDHRRWPEDDPHDDWRDTLDRRR